MKWKLKESYGPALAGGLVFHSDLGTEMYANFSGIPYCVSRADISDAILALLNGDKAEDKNGDLVSRCENQRQLIEHLHKTMDEKQQVVYIYPDKSRMGELEKCNSELNERCENQRQSILIFQDKIKGLEVNLELAKNGHDHTYRQLCETRTKMHDSVLQDKRIAELTDRCASQALEIQRLNDELDGQSHTIMKLRNGVYLSNEVMSLKTRISKDFKELSS